MVMTERGYEDPSVRQLAVFLQNRVGQLREALKTLDGAGVCVQALAITDSADFAVLRLVVDRTEAAARALTEAGFVSTEVQALAVEIPEDPNGLLSVCRALIQGEININYCFPMLSRPRGRACVVIHVDSRSTAADILRRNGFGLLDEADLLQQKGGGSGA
ncbi:MAG TPA: acetolactate synthase [Planctomycetota bacterium]|nr:acetolactate synthase [Planctomycetota bacterium]